MINKPVVSVVMPVYKNASHVKKTIDSVFAQTGVTFEFIIVSDGADDDVFEVISKISDSRLKLIKQKNQGITKALINGCRHATSDFIARIDAGDTMTKSRLSSQSKHLTDHPSICIVSSWVAVTTEEGYFLYDVKQNEAELDASLRATNQNELRSFFHASVMFRRSVYQQVGGYRQEFYFSQDCDLWSRMIEKSSIAVIPQTLTVGIFSAKGISGQHADSQKQISCLIAGANKLRQGGISDASVLEQAKKIRPEWLTDKTSNDFNGLYFIAKVLSDNRSKFAKKYWFQAFKLKPMNVKVSVYFLMSLFYFF